MASRDAYVLIVKTTVERVSNKIVVLVIVTASCDPSKKKIFKKPGREGKKDQIYNVPQIAMNAILKNTIMFVHAFTNSFRGKTHLFPGIDLAVI